ncbi:hypothetical protein JZU61_04535 [bacterium]|jgi:hypothetical protein|nr:hypothetical protein [bacterium]
MKLTTKIMLIVIIVLLIAFSGLGYLYRENLAEVRRQTSNVENLVKKHNQELSLTREEWRNSDTKWSHKLDSLLKAQKIALNKVKDATVVDIQYRDTGSVKIFYLDPVLKPDKSYSIPVSYFDSCWGMSGQILSADRNSKLQIDVRRADNSIQLLVTRSRFLGFLWWKKGETFKAYSDCGEVTFTKINFIKK